MNSTLKPILSALILTFTLVPFQAFGQQLDSEQSAFLTLINNYRAQNGAGPLQISVKLQNSSMWMSTDMATKNYFSHTDSLGRDPGTRIASFGYTYYPWGENIAAGNSDAQNTFTQWVNACDADASGTCTYAHRLNMLNASFKVIGIGRAYGASSTYRWYWTTDFGGVIDQTPPPPSPSPTIASFTASPSVITAGQSTNLIWSVSGATSISLDNGIGTVTNVTSKSVGPAQTTTYTLTATNSSGSSSTRVTVTVNGIITDPSPAFITGQSPGSASNTFTGLLGMQFTTGSSALRVTSLGRMCVSGNTGTHLLKLVQANGSDLNGGSATVSMSGCTSGQYQYASFVTPVTLTPNTAYYLQSMETSGGDAWFSYGQVTVAAGAGVVNGPAYFYGSYYTQAIPGNAYGPVNFHYSTSSIVTVPPSVSITSPAAGSASGTVMAMAQVTSGSNSVASVQFKLNGGASFATVSGAPYSAVLDTTKLTTGATYQLTAVATDTLGNSATSAPVAITVSNSGSPTGSGSGSPLITAQSPGVARNNFSGLLGMQFTTGSKALTVSSVGRFCIAGNSGSHSVKLVTIGGTDVTGTSVSVAMAGCTPGTYKYQALPAAVVLAANSTYYLVSQEVSGGDQWDDYGPVTSTAAVTVNGPAYFYGFAYYALSAPGSAYGPVNLQYQ